MRLALPFDAESDRRPFQQIDETHRVETGDVQDQVPRIRSIDLCPVELVVRPFPDRDLEDLSGMKGIPHRPPPGPG